MKLFCEWGGGEQSPSLDSVPILVISFLLFARDPGYRVRESLIFERLSTFLHSQEKLCIAGARGRAWANAISLGDSDSRAPG